MDTPEGKDRTAAAPPADGCEPDESPEQEETRAPSSEPSSSSSSAQEDHQEDENSQETPTPSSPTPTPTTPTPPPHCYGIRAYDGGYFDVGSFFVLHPSEGCAAAAAAGGSTSAAASSSQSTSEAPGAQDERGAGPNNRPPPFAQKQDAARHPSPLGFEFLDGLKVKSTRGLKDREVEGEGSEGAMRAFAELERQVGK